LVIIINEVEDLLLFIFDIPYSLSTPLSSSPILFWV
jgi:hypothetical protein